MFHINGIGPSLTSISQKRIGGCLPSSLGPAILPWEAPTWEVSGPGEPGRSWGPGRMAQVIGEQGGGLRRRLRSGWMNPEVTRPWSVPVSRGPVQLGEAGRVGWGALVACACLVLPKVVCTIRGS